ncbi:hypothetical protein EVAR_80689_1 [Eumeta japonica]|uniref:Uncharacterized protein n=1 Tax=Eumeta variegata TaxID=151549 RepID=A0A4C1U3R5_EUMVA|nr:hypothetical protein EVAR_80689_1 [Eumeta japonica]
MSSQISDLEPLPSDDEPKSFGRRWGKWKRAASRKSVYWPSHMKASIKKGITVIYTDGTVLQEIHYVHPRLTLRVATQTSHCTALRRAVCRCKVCGDGVGCAVQNSISTL